jgi:hypothetical protein
MGANSYSNHVTVMCPYHFLADFIPPHCQPAHIDAFGVLDRFA